MQIEENLLKQPGYPDGGQLEKGRIDAIQEFWLSSAEIPAAWSINMNLWHFCTKLRMSYWTLNGILTTNLN